MKIDDFFAELKRCRPNKLIYIASIIVNANHRIV